MTGSDGGELELADAGPFIAQENLDLVDAEGGDEAVTQASFNDVVTQYLQTVRANV